MKKEKIKYKEDDGRTIYPMDSLYEKSSHSKQNYNNKKPKNISLTKKEKRALRRALAKALLPMLISIIIGFTIVYFLLKLWLK